MRTAWAQMGDFTRPKQTTYDRYEFPFSQWGDNCFLLYREYLVNPANYSPKAIGTEVKCQLGRAYLSDFTPPTVDGSLLRYQETYASIPKTRFEPSTYSHTSKYIINNGVPQAFMEGYTSIKPVQIRYEYKINQPFDIIEGLDILSIAGNLRLKGEWPDVFNYVSDPFAVWHYPGLALAVLKQLSKLNLVPLEDSEVGIWQGNIYYRKTILGVYPVAFRDKYLASL